MHAQVFAEFFFKSKSKKTHQMKKRKIWIYHYSKKKNIMKNRMLIFLFLLLSFLQISCNSTEQDKIEITQNIALLYIKQPTTIDSIPKNLISKDLMKIFDSYKKIAKEDADRIAKSASPTDKPILFEGSLFTSLYEGYTTYKIQDISILGNQAKVTINFENASFQPIIKWSETAILINENGWKIDNVLFNERNSVSKNLKDSFIQ